MIEPLALGVDLGGTKIAAALVNAEGTVLASSQVPTGLTTPPAVVGLMADEVNALLQRATGPILGLGVGTPGRTMADRGIVTEAINLGWGEVRLADEIRRRLSRDLPVLIQKDANALALGECYFGAARGCRDFIYLSIGTGLGCGAMVNGGLILGANWNPTELGHLSLDPDGLRCTCGQAGCAETVLSGPGMVNLARALMRRRQYVTSLSPGGLTPQAILAAARRGDPLAGAVVSQMGRWLGLVVAVGVAVLNPARVVIGGGVGLAAFDLLVPAAWDELGRRVTGPSRQLLKILPARMTTSAVGAACLVWQARGQAAPPAAAREDERHGPPPV